MPRAKSLKALFVIAAALALYLPLQAEVKVLLIASKIINVDGTEKKESGNKAKPGEVIEYVAEYKNPDKSPVKDVVATLPVPAGMEYLPNTAMPSQVMASTSDGKFAPLPLKRAVRGDDGLAGDFDGRHGCAAQTEKSPRSLFRIRNIGLCAGASEICPAEPANLYEQG